MKFIYNSLGSNYSFSFAIYCLYAWLWSRENSLSKLSNKLSQEFNGKTFLFYKGRDAIEFSLKSLGIGNGNQVLTQAFICWAVEEGITRSGAQPLFADIAINSVNLTVDTLEKAFHKAKNAKAVIVQHTLGYPANINKISQWCKKNNLLLIEDLAQAYGACDREGNPLGTYADVVVLSFGRDKIIDAVSGGAAVIKSNIQDTRFKKNLNKIQVDSNINLYQKIKDLLYPLLTWKIRVFYPLGLGKIIHFLVKNLGFLSSPTSSPTSKMTHLPSAYAALALKQFKTTDSQLQHRKALTQYYQNKVKKFSFVSNELINRASNLRYPIVVSNPDKLISCLKLNNLYLSDRWYRKPVDSGSLNRKSLYKKGSCPNAEKLSETIFNLPTHINITDKDAEKIAETIINFYEA